MSGRDPRGSSRQSDRATSEFQARRQQRQQAEQRRSQLADELGIEEELVELRDRRSGTRVQPSEQGQQVVERRIADESEYLEPEDVDTTISEDGRIDVGATESGRQRAQQRADEQAVEKIQDELPSREDLILSDASSDVTSTAIEFRNALQTGRIEDRADVGVVTGGGDGINDIPESPVEAIASADPQEAEELLGIDPDELRDAQEEIGELREQFEDDPSQFEEAALDNPSGVIEEGRFIRDSLETGRQRRSAARQREDEIASELAETDDSISRDDVDIRVDPQEGTVETALSGVGQETRQGGFERDFARQTAAEEFDAQTDIEVGVGDVTIDDGSARLRESAQQREIERQRDQVANDFGVEPDDIRFDEDDEEFELREEAEDELREEQIEAAEEDAFEQLDEQTARDLDIDDVTFERTDDGVEARVTREVVQESRREPIEIDDGPMPTNDFRGQSSVEGIGLEDPLQEERSGIGFGSTTVLDAGEDFPDSFADIRNFEPGDEVFTSDLPTNQAETQAAVRQTSRDVITAPIPDDFEIADLDPRNIDIDTSSRTGQAAAAAGAAVAAPEPASTTIGGVALGAIGLAVGLAELSRRQEIDVPDESPTTTQSELEAGQGRAEVTEVTIEEETTATSEISVPENPRQPTTASELDVPASRDTTVQELGVPQIEAQQFASQDLESLIRQDEISREEATTPVVTEGEILDRVDDTAEIARQQQEQVEFETEERFGEVNNEDFFTNVDPTVRREFDDIDGGISGAGAPETFDGAEESFGDRFQRIAEERLQETEQRTQIDPFVFPASAGSESAVEAATGIESVGQSTSLFEGMSQQPASNQMPGVGNEPDQDQSQDTDLFESESAIQQQTAFDATFENPLFDEPLTETANEPATETVTETATEAVAEEPAFENPNEFAEPAEATAEVYESSTNTRKREEERLPDFDFGGDGGDEFDIGFDDAVVEFGVDSLDEIDDDLGGLFDE